MQPVILKICRFAKLAELAEVDAMVIDLTRNLLTDSHREVIEPGFLLGIFCRIECATENIIIESEISIRIESDIRVQDQRIILLSKSNGRYAGKA